jgi:hypothetical protein
VDCCRIAEYAGNHGVLNVRQQICVMSPQSIGLVADPLARKCPDHRRAARRRLHAILDRKLVFEN